MLQHLKHARVAAQEDFVPPDADAVEVQHALERPASRGAVFVYETIAAVAEESASPVDVGQDPFDDDTPADVDAAHERAVAAGAIVVSAPEDAFYGGRGCSLQDPEGNLWHIGSPWLDSDAARNLPERRI